jgi:Xaa-Pro aminopeptidase
MSSTPSPARLFHRPARGPADRLPRAGEDHQRGGRCDRRRWRDRPPADLDKQIARLGAAKAKVRLDATTAASALATLIREAGGTPDTGTDPIALMKARKNAAELAGARAAHLRDGAAMVRYLSWLAREAPKGGLTEIDAAALEPSGATGLLKDVSFTTIAGAGPTPPCRITASARRATASSSPASSWSIQAPVRGRHHRHHRTIVIGEPTAEMRDRYTRVLKGHVAISRLVFVKGTPARSSMPSRGCRSGRAASTSTTAPATASAAICRCMRARSGCPSSAPRRCSPA